MAFLPLKEITNGRNQTAFKEITIKGLFGRSDVTMRFGKIANIYIGENGLGKTTVLNCIYYILHEDYEKLAKIPFDKITLKFNNGEKTKTVTISSQDVSLYCAPINSFRTPRGLKAERYISIFLYQYDNNLSVLSDPEIYRTLMNMLEAEFKCSPPYAKRLINEYLMFHEAIENEIGNRKKVHDMKNAVSDFITEQVIYLTTYRRIEKDYSDYFNHDRDRMHFSNEEALIRFGMRDVTEAIDHILSIIRDKSNQGFNTMTSVLLKKNIGESLRDEDASVSKSNLIDEDLVEIVLNRLGAQIEEIDKKSIVGLVKNKKIYEKKHQFLLDLIDELINNYNRLKNYDQQIIEFKDTCNRYLIDKEFQYNQNDITLKLFSRKTGKELDLSVLSSGEKQIVSLFSRLYLESEKKCILLIDEPELSISMMWQKMLLPDIIRSKNCSLLLTVTHSPFIFDNEFDNDAEDMGKCFTDHFEV